MATNLGRVGMVMKGTYNSASTYETLDAVTYNNGLYVAKQNVPAGTTPVNTSYWQPAIDASGLVPPNGYNHNGIYRGSNLGTISSLAQLEAFLTEHEVATGKFTNLYLGDYIKIQDGTYNGNWCIAGFGTEANKGSANIPNKNTLSLIPSGNLTSASMNSTNTTGVSKNTNNPLYAETQGVETVGYQAYWGSDMAQITMPDIEAKLTAVLGTHLKTRDILCSTTMTPTTPSMAGAGANGASTNWGWKAVKAALMTEVQVYGSTVYSSSSFDVGEGYEKLPIFNFISPVGQGRADWWLRAVASSSNFARAGNTGNAGAYGASYAFGVRPLIVVG